jgi:hypothetical protein
MRLVFPSVVHFRLVFERVASERREGLSERILSSVSRLLIGFYAVELMAPGLVVTRNTSYLEKA